MKILKIELAALLAMILACVLSVTSFADTCVGIRESVLRLHVIANSDSEEDQALKLKVRDAVLQAGDEIFAGSVTRDEAKAKIEPNIEKLKAAAKKVIEENGFDYPVEITVSEEYFPTRTYEKFTLPAGKYMAVRVVIGDGKGQNWWCIMFPPLCLPAAKEEASIDSVLNEKQVALTEKSPEYEPRFKIIEIYEKIKNELRLTCFVGDDARIVP